jgi:hypothetical protein
MNLFRSGEHVRAWSRYDPETSEGTLPVRDWARIFAAEEFRRRLEPDYFLNLPGLIPSVEAVIRDMGKKGPFWGIA